MKIAIDENIPYVEGRIPAPAQVVYLDQNAFTPDTVADADALMIRTRTICNESLLAGSKVKLVATATIGTDQIDIPWCAAHGIEVANAPGCNAPAVAQYVWSSILRLGFRPGKDRLGIVGCGNVGRIVREWARLLSTEVMVSDPFRPEDNTHSLQQILEECDAVTLHTPLTRDGDHPTYHLIGEPELRIMKQNAILVNAARGAVVDFNALRRFIEEKQSLQLVIDTWEGEPKVDPVVLGAARIATFHIAGYSRCGKERATRMALEALERFFKIKTDKTGLADAYRPLTRISAEEIISSYNPFDDDRLLRENPDAFERLRHDYCYREEVVIPQT